MARNATPRKTTTSSRRPRKSARSTNQDLTTGEDFQREESSTRSRRNLLDASSGDYREILRELATNPAVKYVAGGIATALLTKFANKMAARYPEISSFIRENMDSLEGKFSEYNRDLKGESARH